MMIGANIHIITDNNCTLWLSHWGINDIPYLTTDVYKSMRFYNTDAMIESCKKLAKHKHLAEVI